MCAAERAPRRRSGSFPAQGRAQARRAQAPYPPSYRPVRLEAEAAGLWLDDDGLGVVRRHPRKERPQWDVVVLDRVDEVDLPRDLRPPDDRAVALADVVHRVERSLEANRVDHVDPVVGLRLTGDERQEILQRIPVVAAERVAAEIVRVLEGDLPGGV